MEKKKTKKQVNIKSFKDNCMKPHHCHHHSGSAIYGLGFIGSAVYYISTATGFWNGVLGFLKAMVWPAFLVFHAMKFLGM